MVWLLFSKKPIATRSDIKKHTSKNQGFDWMSGQEACQISIFEGTQCRVVKRLGPVIPLENTRKDMKNIRHQDVS